MKRYIYGINRIIDFLQSKKTDFKIYLCNQTTNYNIYLKVLYLNYSDLFQIDNLLKETFNPPFIIQINTNLKTLYYFDIENKILFLKEPLF